MAPLIPIAMQLAQYAPSIIKLLTGSDKAEEVAGKVVDVARAVTGLTKAENAVAAIVADPVKAMEFQLAMGAQQSAFEQMYLSDVQNARAMQVAALGQDDLFSKRFVYYFAAAWSLFTMFYVVGITFWPPMEESGKSNSATVLGFLLGTAVSMIFAYFYGSTKGSAEKTRLIASSK
jgi:hypothetical protein